MPREGWISISLPKEMVEEVKRVIRERPELGYKSVGQLVSEAIRSLLREYGTYRPEVEAPLPTPK